MGPCLIVEVEAFGKTQINISWVRSSLVIQSPVDWSPMSGVQTHPPTVAPRHHRPHSTEDNIPRLFVKSTLNSPEYLKTLTPKSSNISRKVSGPVVSSVGPTQSQIWPYSTLYLLSKSTVVPKVHNLQLIVDI